MIKVNTIPAKPLAFKNRIKVNEFTFVQTSKFYPEAYDIFDHNGTQVGHASLRWGRLSCHYLNKNGERFYESFFERDHMGEFDTEEQRRIFLEDVANALSEKISGHIVEKPQFECIKWFTKYGFTFAEKGDKLRLVERMQDGSWIMRAENGAIQIIGDKQFQNHFCVKIVVNEENVSICA